MLHIGLNGTCFDERPSGARQRFELIYGAVIRDNPEISFTIFEPEHVRVGEWFPFANVRAVRTPIRPAGALRKAVTEMGYWRRALADARLDLLDVFNLPLPGGAPCPMTLTIHDIRYVKDDVAQPRRAINRIIARRAFGRVDRIIAVSDTMRREVLDFRPRTPVTTIHNGIDVSGFAPDDEGRVHATLTRYDVKQPYALAVGHLEPRKNYTVLMQAFAALRDRGSALRLVVVGRDGGGEADIRRLVTSLGLDSVVTFLSDVGDAELRDLYAGCDQVVFPSRYEGFGIPVLEAMAARRPLVTSDIAVFRELTQDRGCYFPAADPTALADRIDQVFRDGALRDRLIAYGEERLPDFAPTALAAQVVAVYRDVLAARQRR